MRSAALAILCALAAWAVAAPTIDIRAQTQLALDKVRLSADGVAELSGQLIDKHTGDGLGGQTVTIRVAGGSVTATTTPDGRFRAVIHVLPGPQPVELRFNGGALLEPAVHTQVTDPARAQVTLSILVEERTAGTALTVTATADDQPAKLRIDLSVGAPTDTDLAPLPGIETGAAFVLTRKLAGGSGARRVRATFPGDATRQAATTEVTVEMTATTATLMTVSSKTLAYEDELRVIGKVTDDDDQPVARAAVTLVSGDRRLAQGATAADGTYKFEIEAELIGQGQFAVQVQSDPGLSYVKPSRSTPAIVKVDAPQPVPVAYTIAAFVATVFAAGGFFTARAKPWRRLRRRAPAAEVPSNQGEIDVRDGGLVSNKPSVMSTLRRPSDDGFAGAVRDTVRSRPVPQAVVRLLLGEIEHEIRTSNDGSFALEQLASGEWRAEVAAPGHVTEKFVVSIPHRGELRGVRIDLVPVRERVFQMYRRVAEPVLPEARLWGIWSPRQIVDHVRSQRPSPALSDLTDFVEEIYFSSRLAAETVLAQAADRVDRASRERPASG